MSRRRSTLIRGCKTLRVVLTDLDGVIRQWPAPFAQSVEDRHGLERGSLARAACCECDRGEVLFVDDRAENVAAAIDFGFRGHHYRDPRTLQRVLREYGVIREV